MSSYRRLFLTVATGALLAGMVPGLVAAGSGIGAALQLGVGNTVSAMTGLAATTVNPALWVKNTGPGIQITVGAGQAPIIVTGGAGKATNLDADKLDGKDSTGFQNKITKLTDLNAIGCGPNGMLLLATTDITCIADNWEPNNTQATSAALARPTNTSAISGGGDNDWYYLDSPPCSETQCAPTLGIDSVNVVMDVYMNGGLKATGVKLYSQLDPYSGPTPIYVVRVYSTNREPYKLSYF
jgi:hypothetical protein